LGGFPAGPEGMRHSKRASGWKNSEIEPKTQWLVGF